MASTSYVYVVNGAYGNCFIVTVFKQRVKGDDNEPRVYVHP